MKTVSLSGHCTRCAGLVYHYSIPENYRGKICYCPENDPNYQGTVQVVGWKCPNCSSGNSPNTLYCPQCSSAKKK